MNKLGRAVTQNIFVSRSIDPAYVAIDIEKWAMKLAVKLFLENIIFGKWTMKLAVK
jgi:hypothetical protein